VEGKDVEYAHMTTLPSSRSRDAALHRLSRCNRWLLAGSVTLTGVFTAIAAQAFPGKARTGAAAKGAGTSGKAARSRRHATHAHAAHRSSPSKALTAPAQAPEGTSTSSQDSGEGEVTKAEQAATSTQASSSAPEAQTSTTEQTTTPTETPQTTETPTSGSSSESSSAPVVSGGS
jgi:hypothetical protein